MVEIQSLAAGALAAVQGGRSLDVALAATWRRHGNLSARARAAVRDLSYGSLRALGLLEAQLELLLEKPLKDGRLRALLLVVLYQLSSSRSAPHAVVDHAVRSCQNLGFTSAKGLVNAVLRNFLRRREQLAAQARQRETARFSHPQWWIDKLRSQYPGDYAEVLESANLHPPLALRVNVRRTSVEAYLERLAGESVEAARCGVSAVVLRKPVPAERIPGLAEGLVSVQDAAAQLAAPMLDVRDGMRVLDACAAPGGKACHLLELAQVSLTALDSDEARLDRLRANLARLGLSARVVCGDAAAPSAWWDGAPFDRILLDAPCTGSGVARRHPDIKWLRRETDVAQFARSQAHMLDALWQTLASGGKLLYATCSVFQEENHAQVEHFLERHRDATRLTLPPVDDDEQQRAGQWLPDESHDGFYYALLEKA